ncbi:hypothetical protein Ana3638_20750 [Anaerocolumna sedimenticola]|uniref:Uncharacterized protein n=1 Tax=Anaerocolumna sedimenticola TaxID=2696063 RepID=A0A6P1TRD7_9FIRM|nr:hypothetical protein [Anaerocolumna sedimenticola]QHQ62907.1 hypothetical protein Ana3638_20750 [Anaerocolumna sedimenticola]
MINKDEELINIITKFAESGWSVIDEPSKVWLNANNNDEVSEKVTTELIAAVEKADNECGSCGCEFDPLYKRALVLLGTAIG